MSTGFLCLLCFPKAPVCNRHGGSPSVELGSGSPGSRAEVHRHSPACTQVPGDSPSGGRKKGETVTGLPPGVSQPTVPLGTVPRVCRPQNRCGTRCGSLLLAMGLRASHRQRPSASEIRAGLPSTFKDHPHGTQGAAGLSHGPVALQELPCQESLGLRTRAPRTPPGTCPGGHRQHSPQP